uniref:RING-type domain-containing protein n=1 Tax=Ascaris lumbricoides TaxID=6252 RepID=A0A0M3IIQ6_ASCLU
MVEFPNGDPNNKGKDENHFLSRFYFHLFQVKIFRPTFAYSFSFFEETSKLSSSTNSFKDVTFPIKRYQSSNKIIEQDEAMRCCDGPCSQMRNIRDLWQFGRCDHAICSMCLANAPLANAPDGWSTKKILSWKIYRKESMQKDISSGRPTFTEREVIRNYRAERNL